jgi:predicted dehydrogenase
MRIAVIGAGSIGQRHAGNLASLGHEAQLMPWRGFTATALRAFRPRAAVIATATPVRLEIVALCADLGLPVYVEKPLAYDSTALADLMAAAAPVADRSMAGFMMRWHPAFRALARLDLSQVYDAGFGIGHDVRLWRKNWSFAASYAAQAQGGGVLLDLCHEIDMALTLLPQTKVGAVQSLGHRAFPGVDFASRIALEGPGLIGTVAMDYLSPVSFRRICLRGRDIVADFDLIAGRYTLDRGQGSEGLDLPFERNQMFLAAMSDFLHLVAGEAVSDVEHLPRLDRVAASSAGIARAWEARAFTGEVTGDYR